jgi:hypothetical protein
MKQNVADYLNGNGPWHVAIVSFTVSHSSLVIGLYRESFPNRIEVICGDTDYIRGSVMGGPHVLCVQRDSQDPSNWSISSSSDEFLVRCGRMSWVEGREPGDAGRPG